MILGAEIGLAIYGLIALIRGKFSMGKEQPIEGWQARLLGFVCMCTIPIAVVTGIIFGIVMAVLGKDMSTYSSFSFVWIDILALVIVLSSCAILAKIFRASNVRVISEPPSPSVGSIDPQNPYGQRFN